MAVSTFDLFKIGIGPSSSHTVGPMRAAARFVQRWLAEPGQLQQVARIRAEVFGSLALTGRGHGTDKALLLGLEGHQPNSIDPDIIPATLERIRKDKAVQLPGGPTIGFDEKRDLAMNKRQKLPFHTNGMRFTAWDADGNELATRDYYSVGGGFVVNSDEASVDRIVADQTPLPYPFHSGDELLAAVKNLGRSGQGIASDVMAFFSPKGKSGKTTLIANLALTLAQKTGDPVAVIDADWQFGDMAVFFNLTPQSTIVEAVRDIRFLSPFTLNSYFGGFTTLCG